jgi:hypothetical protein
LHIRQPRAGRFAVVLIGETKQHGEGRRDCIPSASRGERAEEIWLRLSLPPVLQAPAQHFLWKATYLRAMGIRLSRGSCLRLTKEEGEESKMTHHMRSRDAFIALSTFGIETVRQGWSRFALAVACQSDHRVLLHVHVPFSCASVFSTSL